MNDFLDQISRFSDPLQVMSLAQILICLVMSFMLCLIAAKTYEITYRGVSFSPSFMHTIVLCGMVIGSVMLIIGSNIARAFSLVGALSIIRFRNAVKDPRDVAYIFLAMGIGMACGTGFYQIAICITLLTCLAAFIMYWMSFGQPGLSEKILRIQAPAAEHFENIFNDTLKLHSHHFSLLSVESSRMGTELELTFVLKVGKKFDMQALINDLSKLNNNLKIQISGSSHVLEL